MTQGEAIVIEFRALRCLKQAETNGEFMQTARTFARRAARKLHAAKYFAEASSVAKKLLTVTADNTI